MSTGFDNAVKLLGSLSKDELLRLSEQAKALASLSSDGKSLNDYTVTNSVDDFVLQTVFECQRRAGLGTYFAMLRKEAARPTTKAKIEATRKFLESVDTNRQGQSLILATGVTALIENLRQIGIPVTGPVILRQLHRLPAVLDLHFPGYWQHDLLHMIVRKEKPK